jgi:hypothetical protein
MITQMQRAYFELVDSYDNNPLEQGFWRMLGNIQENLPGSNAMLSALITDGDEATVVRFLWFLQGRLFAATDCPDGMHEIVRGDANPGDEDYQGLDIQGDACSRCGAILERVEDSGVLPLPFPPGG